MIFILTLSNILLILVEDNRVRVRGVKTENTV
jgi:hypothetical protein